ncbi:MAG: helix-turn-helix domain-containing protein [Bdellovibrionota bacterium]
MAVVTKIHLQQLKGLEEGWPSTIPALAIVRGITVSYAKHLGLDEVDVIDRFKQHQGEFKEKVAALVKPDNITYTSQSGKPLRFGSYSERKEQSKLTHWLSTKRTLYGFLVLLGFVLLIFYGTSVKKRAVKLS